MKTQHVTVLTASVLAAVLASPAGAAAKTSPTHFVAPYANSLTGTPATCFAGTTCSPTVTASKETGRVLAAMDISRDNNDQQADENGQGHGDLFMSVRPPAGATKLTATFAWRVGSASSSVTATHGEIYAGSHLHAYASCGSCTSTDELVTVDEARMTAGLPSTNPSHSVQDTTFQLTVTITNIARNATITLYGQAAAYAGMGTSSSCYVTPAGCVVLAPPDSGHAGTAHATIDATLTAVDLVYG